MLIRDPSKYSLEWVDRYLTALRYKNLHAKKTLAMLREKHYMTYSVSRPGSLWEKALINKGNHRLLMQINEPVFADELDLGYDTPRNTPRVRVYVAAHLLGSPAADRLRRLLLRQNKTAKERLYMQNTRLNLIQLHNEQATDQKRG